MFKNSLKICLITLLTLGLAFTSACGGDDDDNNATNNKTENNKKENNKKENNKKENNKAANNSGGAEVQPTACESANPPARCSATIEGFDFGTASVITEFKLAAPAEDCCFDYDDDDKNDNVLGTVLNSTGQLITVNDTIAESITDGTLTLILEHDGLENLEGDDFTINFFLGQYDGDDLLINPASFDQGTQPLAFLPDAKLTADGDVSAGPGSVMLSLELFGTNLDLSIRDAKITTKVVAAESTIADGVTLIEGKLGGLIVVQEVYDAVNKVADTCECLGLDGAKLISNDGVCYSSEVDGKKVGIDKTHTCDKETQTACETLATTCGAIVGAGILADQDFDGGEENALSLGATFKAEAATIAGVATE